MLPLGLAESVLGGFEVETKLRIGAEHLIMLFTQNRLIMAHSTKIGRESMSLSNLLGGVARGIGAFSQKTMGLEKMAGMPPESILALHKDNFAVGYDHVVSMIVDVGDLQEADITLVTSDLKAVMSASLTAVRGVREIVESLLGSKVTFRV